MKPKTKLRQQRPTAEERRQQRHELAVNAAKHEYGIWAARGRPERAAIRLHIQLSRSEDYDELFQLSNAELAALLEVPVALAQKLRVAHTELSTGSAVSVDTFV